MIGLGDIASKAYLPILTRKQNIDLRLCTRNADVLRQIGHQYNLTKTYERLDDLIASGISAAFVHTASAAHYEVVHKLLDNNIHVFVDKPITYELSSTSELLTLAKKRKLLLRVGFNRRRAPAYERLRALSGINMIVMQKNRKNLPGEVRRFIFDDFIHVIDTLLYLFPFPISRWTVSGRTQAGQLCAVVINFFSAEGHQAVGIMNRMSGVTDEQLEVFTPAQKGLVYNFSEEKSSSIRSGELNWNDVTLKQRGIEQVVDDFLSDLCRTEPSDSQYDHYTTHFYCEECVRILK